MRGNENHPEFGTNANRGLTQRAATSAPIGGSPRHDNTSGRRNSSAAAYHITQNIRGTVPARLHLTPTSIPPSPTPPGVYINSANSGGGGNSRGRAGSFGIPGQLPSLGGSIPFVPNLALGSPPSTPVQDHYCAGKTTSSPVHSPYLKASKSAIDNAIAHERERIRALELHEAEITSVEELKAALKRERSYSKSIAVELATLKSVAVANTLEAEVNEEGRINCLMRRLDGLQKEKGRIIVELEREEEMLTNTLQKKLNEVRREKAELEKQIEREHMAMAKVKLESIGKETASVTSSTVATNTDSVTTCNSSSCTDDVTMKHE